MGFENFKPKVEDKTQEMKEELDTRRIISGEDVFEENEEDYSLLERNEIRKREEAEIYANNRELLMRQIDENNRKIRQLEDSIKEETNGNEWGEKVIIPKESYEKLIKSLEKTNDKLEGQIKNEEQKISNFYNPDLN